MWIKVWFVTKYHKHYWHIDRIVITTELLLSSFPCISSMDFSITVICIVTFTLASEQVITVSYVLWLISVGSVSNDRTIFSKSKTDMVACPPNVRITSTSWGLSLAVSIFCLIPFNRDDLVFRLWEVKVRLWSLECLLITEIIWSWILRSVQCCDRMLSRPSWNWVFCGIGASELNSSSDSFGGIKDYQQCQPDMIHDQWLHDLWCWGQHQCHC